MKKWLVLALACMCVGSALACAEEVDAYTSASTTKVTLSGEELSAAGALLAANGSDLATLAQTKEEGYTAPDGTNAQILSVNPDGSVGSVSYTHLDVYKRQVSGIWIFMKSLRERES